ncbi:MAG: DNA polymerase I [Firmicutes bacterium]|nr:DNA polymerase I [Bacillota bacterium]
MGKLILIDGNSLLFRAYFAMRPMVTSTGIHTQGIFAFINMLNKIIADYQPDYMAVAFDMKDPTFRHKEYSEYKAGRQQTPIELLSEIPYMHRVLEAMNIAVFQQSGYEADDIIGTIAAQASAKGIKTMVISGDKDELQLIDENTSVLINKKGMSEFDLYDIDKMKERYNLTPSQFIDLKGLMGDKSDNIPGIPGVGEKKGIALLEQYGSLESVIEHADEIKGKLGENVRANIDSAKLSKWLATINTSAPIEFTFDGIKFGAPDTTKLIEIYKELEFNSFIKKLQSVSNDDVASSSSEAPFDAESIKQVDYYDLIAVAEPGEAAVIELFTDNSHTDIPSIDGIALLLPSKALYAVRPVTLFEAEALISSLCELGLKLYACDAKPMAYAAEAVCGRELVFAHDVKIAEYMIYPNQNKYAIAKMLLKYYSYVNTQDEEAYLSENAVLSFCIIDEVLLLKRMGYIYAVALKQNEVMEANGTIELFESCEMPLVTTIASMEKEGIRVDLSVLEQIGTEISGRITELEEAIYGAAGTEFNINSPKQLGTVLFETMQIDYPKAKSKSGSYSTAADILEKLAPDYPIVNDILEFRKLSKLRSTYVEGLSALVGSDGKIHPHFMQTVAATGRLSCTEPNLQNIPIRDDYGRLIRKAFICENEDTVFTGADYSQIELRVLAALSGDPTLIEAFNESKDIHRTTASKVFDIPYDEVTSLDRTRAKAVNFGVVYGMSSHGLSESLGISRKEAQKYIDDYFDTHIAVKNYLDDMITEGESNREVKTYFGRIRQIPEFESRKFMDRELAKRLAMNTPIQGTAADIIKIAMNKVYNALKEEGLESRLILQIHDELIIEGPASEREKVRGLLENCMKSAADFAVELTVEINSASCWYDLK